MDAAAAAAAAVAVVSVTDKCMPNALREAARAMSKAQSLTLLQERDLRLRAERGLARGVADRAKMREEMDRMGVEYGEAGADALRQRLGAVEREREELKDRCEGLVKELEGKEVVVSKLSRTLRTNVYTAADRIDENVMTPVKGGSGEGNLDASYMSLTGLPQHIKNELMQLALVAPADSPLKTGEFWSWLEKTPEKGGGPGADKSLELEVSNDEGGADDDDFKTFEALANLGKSRRLGQEGEEEEEEEEGDAGELALDVNTSFTSMYSDASTLQGEDSAETPNTSMTKSHDASQDSLMMSPTGLRHADNLAKGSADLKEQLRLLMRGENV